MKPQIVFALYRPKPGKDAELRQLLSEHIPTLKRLELITERAPMLVKGQDGTYIEIFEWRDEGASAKAHSHPELARVWESMGQIADFPALSSLAEASKRFPHFDPVAL